MKHLKIILGVVGLVMFIAGAAINLVTYFKLKRQGVEHVFKYVKANPGEVKSATTWGSIASIGFWLCIASVYIND